MNPKQFIQERFPGIKIGPLVISILMIPGPLWGYIAMFICKLINGGDLLDTITFYMMVIGWMMLPIGSLIILYMIVTTSIISERRRNSRD